MEWDPMTVEEFASYQRVVGKKVNRPIQDVDELVESAYDVYLSTIPAAAETAEAAGSGVKRS